MSPAWLNKALLQKWIKITGAAFAAILFVFLILDARFPFLPTNDYSQVIKAADGSVLYAFLNNEDKWRMKAELDEISPELKKTILFKEDKYFYFHFGVNPVAVARALIQNTYRGTRISGASTITMQLARLLDPKPRTYQSKLIEMFRAVQLEWHFSKEEILQLYLNHLPYGGNIEGVKAASLIFFEQSPQVLSLAQIVTLSIIPNRPSAFNARNEDPELLKNRNHWLDLFHDKHLFDAQLIQDAKKEPLNVQKHEVPRSIPHLANRIHSQYPGYSSVTTFIDPELQTRIETVTWNHIRQLRGKGIRNAAVIVVQNDDRKVISYLGSSHFEDAESQGQVDGVRSVRSPGSTLKPFLYALAIDKGMITPATMLLDVPSHFSGYDPENYDGAYRGMISVKNALALSLNVPAVRLMDDVQENYFIDYLIKAGFKSIERKRKELGLSVILGGCGVTLEELTNLFASFASGGVYSPARLIGEEPVLSPDTLMSKSAAFLVTEMLTSLKRPDFPARIEQIIDMPRIAWKTGTSYGRRDAWSIGFNTAYTVGVWIGNFKGDGVHELNGSDFAAPLLFRVFHLLETGNRRQWFDPPTELSSRIVCSRSGLPPADFCTDLIEDYFIPGVSPSLKCEHLRSIFVNEDSTVSFCRSCLPLNGYKRKWYPNYPPEVITFMNEQAIPYERIPQHNPGCERIFYELAPSIISLTENAEYILFRNEKQRLKLACHAENDVGVIFWYVNNRFLASARIQDPVFFEPPEGELKISCLDDKGRNTDIWIMVKYI